MLHAYLDAPLPYSVDAWTKADCPKGCNAQKRFYCINCLCYIGIPPQAQVPRLRLPLHVDLVMADNRKKSTAIQVGVVAAESVRVWDWWAGDLEAMGKEAWDVDRTLVLFPSQGATTLDALSPADLAGLERVVLLDSRWNNTTKVLEHPGLARLTRRVKLKDPPSESKCWRYHSKGEGHLSSAEALYYLLKEYEGLTGQHALGADGQAVALEEMLYLFRLNMNVIQHHYQQDEKKQGLPLPMEEAGKTRMREVRSNQKNKLKKQKHCEKEGVAVP